MVLIAGHIACDIFTVSPPEGTVTVSEFLNSPVYDSEVRLSGRVGDRGVYSCPCFRLASGGESLMVWYDSIEGGFPAVGLINNGDRVIVTGTFTRLIPSEKSTSLYPSETRPLDPHLEVKENPRVQEHFSIKCIEKV
ncbi:MAG: hypothetical protein QMC96_12710 [Methanomicrobiales archaeon]|nr:hypothetical protein [Methanomicrobiales archaeon]